MRRIEHQSPHCSCGATKDLIKHSRRVRADGSIYQQWKCRPCKRILRTPDPTAVRFERTDFAAGRRANRQMLRKYAQA